MPSISHEEAQELHLLISGLGGHGFADLDADAARALEIAAVVVSDTDPERDVDFTAEVYWEQGIGTEPWQEALYSIVDERQGGIVAYATSEHMAAMIVDTLRETSVE